MPPKKKTQEDVLQRKRELEKLRYQKIKDDIDKRELLQQRKKEYYMKKKSEGIVKSVKDLTPRGQRQLRKQWRENTTKYRQKKKCTKDAEREIPCETELIPSGEPVAQADQLSTISEKSEQDGRIAQARKRAERNRRLKNSRLKQKDKTISELKMQIIKYQKLLHKVNRKSQINSASPRSKVDEIVKGDVSEIKKKLLFGEVMKQQLNQNYNKIKNPLEKRVFVKAVSGDAVKKYKVLSKENIITKKQERAAPVTDSLLKNQRKERSDKVSEDTKRKIIVFLEKDEKSRICAGKKETKTKNKEKKQKRYLLESMKRLHQKYNKENENEQVSYSMFCKFRPFWIIKPTVEQRNTCLCLLHSNFGLLIQALYKHNIIVNISTTDQFLEAICCDKYNEICISRKCKICHTQNVIYSEFDNESTSVNYMQWEYVTETVFINKSKTYKAIKKISKVSHTAKPYDIVIKFEDYIPKFTKHQQNIVHQYAAIKKCKENVTVNDVLIHVDFSENYSTKYGSEVQAFHFGGSRSQISLHTGVVYWKGESETQCQSFCTMSEILDHDAFAIWAHLQPIFDWVSTNLKSVTNLHFLSDGPTAQYRNKHMFYILANKLKYLYENFTSFSWNFSEAGHGKGAPDGIGAVCKRTADRMVALGRDIPDLQNLQTVLKEHCPSILIYSLESKDFENAKLKLFGKFYASFPGTLKVHQITGTKDKFKLKLKSLSCFCENMFQCNHHLLGSLDYVESYMKSRAAKKIYSSSESDDNMLPPTDNNIIKAGPSRVQNDVEPYRNGDYVLVKFRAKNSEYKYAGVCVGDIDEDGEIKVTFLKICDDNGRLFKIDDSSVYDVLVEDIIIKLPQPTLCPKGERIYYKFKHPVDVFEQ